MMIEQHYDEEVLAGFLAEPIDSAARDRHLAGCSRCKQTLKSIRDTAGLLKQPDVWSHDSFSSAPRPETLSFLRNVQRTMADEDAAAEVYVKQLLAGTRDMWAARLAEHPEWRTAGVVRKLIAATDRAIDLMPSDAVEITALAFEIVEHLRVGEYPASLVSQLRLSTLYERSYALQTADLVQDAGTSEFERARLDLVRALVYRTLERRDEALVIAHTTANTFRAYDDFGRYAAARCAEAIVLYHARRFREAVAIHVALAKDVRVDRRWRASSLHNAALCYRELRDFENSIQFTLAAIEAFDREQMMSHRVKSRWNLARVFAAQQRHAEAVEILPAIQEEFRTLGMAIDVALVAVDMAESLLALGRVTEIPVACGIAMDYFRSAKLAYTEGALVALATIREAAAHRTLTEANVRDLRSFFERLAREPQVMYASRPG